MKALLTAILTASILVSSYVMLHAYEETHHAHHDHDLWQVSVEEILADFEADATGGADSVYAVRDAEVKALADEVRRVSTTRRGLGVPDWASAE